MKLAASVPPWDGPAKTLAAVQHAAQAAAMSRGLIRIVCVVGAAAVLIAAVPAVAATGISIPEPTDLTLLGLAVAGLIYGRQHGKRPPEE
jgi:hypothetical protein